MAARGSQWPGWDPEPPPPPPPKRKPPTAGLVEMFGPRGRPAIRIKLAPPGLGLPVKPAPVPANPPRPFTQEAYDNYRIRMEMVSQGKGRRREIARARAEAAGPIAGFMPPPQRPSAAEVRANILRGQERQERWRRITTEALGAMQYAEDVDAVQDRLDRRQEAPGPGAIVNYVPGPRQVRVARAPPWTTEPGVSEGTVQTASREAHIAQPVHARQQPWDDDADDWWSTNEGEETPPAPPPACPTASEALYAARQAARLRPPVKPPPGGADVPPGYVEQPPWRQPPMKSPPARQATDPQNLPDMRARTANWDEWMARGRVDGKDSGGVLSLALPPLLYRRPGSCASQLRKGNMTSL